MDNNTIALARIIRGEKSSLHEMFIIRTRMGNHGSMFRAYEGVTPNGLNVVLKQAFREGRPCKYATDLDYVVEEWVNHQNVQNATNQSFADYGVFCCPYDDTLWLIQQRLRGQSLSAFDGNLTIRQCFEIIKSLALFSKDLLAQDYLPLDLKPENIFLEIIGGEISTTARFFDIDSVQKHDDYAKLTATDTWLPCELYNSYENVFHSELLGPWTVTYTIALVGLWLLTDRDVRTEAISLTKDGYTAYITTPFDVFSCGKEILFGHLAEKVSAFLSRSLSRCTTLDELNERRYANIDEFIRDLNELLKLIEHAYAPKVSRRKMKMLPGQVRRPNLCREIAEAFSCSKFVFLSGISGSGKSFLAVEYAQSTDYEASIHIELPESGMEDVSISIGQKVKYDNGASLNDKEKEDIFDRYLSSDEAGGDLILIDNFNACNDQLLERLKGYRGHVLITTQLDAMALETAQFSIEFSCVEILCDHTGKEFCIQLFSSNLGRSRSSIADDSIGEMVALLYYHPLATAIISKQLSLRPNPTGDFEALLMKYRNGRNEALSRGGKVCFRHNQHEKTSAPIFLLAEFMCSRFSAFDWKNNVRGIQCLWLLCLCPGVDLDMETVCTLIGDYSLDCTEAAEAFNELNRNGLVSIKEGSDHTKTVSIHNMLVQALKSSFLGNPPEAFLKHILKNEVLLQMWNADEFTEAVSTEWDISNAIGKLLYPQPFQNAGTSGTVAYLICAYGAQGASMYFADKNGENGQLFIDASFQKNANFRYYPAPSTETECPHHLDYCEIILFNYYPFCENATIEIPSRILGLPVRRISQYAFSGKFSEIMHIPTMVRGSLAFDPTHSMNSTETAIISVASNTFYPCKYMHGIIIPASVTSIGNAAFRCCGRLQSIAIPGSVTSIGDSAFTHCRELKEIIIPESVTSIGDDAFSGCESLSDITIPEGVTCIGKRTFFGCKNLSDITLPKGITSIGGATFSECKSLSNISIPEGVSSIGDGLFADCESLTDIIIPKSVTSIGNCAFHLCWRLAEIIIPESVTSIGDYAFEHCGSLAEIIIPESVTSIGESVFAWCESLADVTIPEGVTCIGTNAFWGCRNLAKIVISESVTGISDYAFCGCESLSDITIPEGVTCIGEFAFGRCKKLTDIVIPKSVTRVGNGAFAWCESLSDITIPEGVIGIGNSVFIGCKSLAEIVIPKGITSIGDDAFFGCESLSDITIPEGVTSIGKRAFKGCESLAEIVIPKGVTTIGDSAFAWCESLADVTIPEGVTCIGKYAFGGCESLRSITIPESVTSIGDNAFEQLVGDPVIVSANTHLTIYAHKDSYAEKYGLEHGIPVRII